jgi:hypothetical protein
MVPRDDRADDDGKDDVQGLRLASSQPSQGQEQQA